LLTKTLRLKHIIFSLLYKACLFLFIVFFLYLKIINQALISLQTCNSCLHDVKVLENSLIQLNMTVDHSSLFKLSLNAVMFCLNNYQNQHFIQVLSDLTSSAAVLVLTAVCSFDRLLLHYLKAEFILDSSVIKSLLNLKSEGILSAVNWHLQLCNNWHDDVTARATAKIKTTARVRTTATTKIKARVSQVCNETDAQLVISKYKKNTMKRKRRASYRSEKIMCFSLRVLVSN